MWGCGAVPGSAHAADCRADHIDEWTRLDHVHDGDTVTLKDGRRLRFIGINTPELPRDDIPGQPYAREAREALGDLLKPNDEIGLRFDGERFDRYGRLLAHVYSKGGVSIQARLLEQGYAVAIVVPPNLLNDDCYHHAEELARKAGSGLWALSYYQALESTRVSHDTTGFRLIRGRVVRTGTSSNAVWVNLEGEIALRIAKSDLGYFHDFRPRDLTGRTVAARGWLYPRRSGLVMQIRHPTALQVIETDATVR